MFLFEKIFLVCIVLAIAYFAVKRLHQKDTENFEDREN
jgi:uncharacterized membrane protein